MQWRPRSRRWAPRSRASRRRSAYRESWATSRPSQLPAQRLPGDVLMAGRASRPARPVGVARAGGGRSPGGGRA
eukprot:6730999-Alexandrium_andersonii.AAC.1